MKVNDIPVKQNANQVTDPSTQVSAEEFNALVDNAKESVTSMEVLAGQEEVKLSYGKGKGTSSTLTFPTATAAGAGMMSPKQAARIADRTATDGMGYVVLDKDKTFAEQVTQENTIYEIRHDFDLGGQTKEIPSGCVLKFEGGSLKNGTLKGNASLITGSEYNILDGVYLNGTWANAECNLRWWGCSPASGVNNSPMIQCAFDSTIPLIRVSEKYGVSYPIGLPYNKKIVGRSALNNQLTGFYANDDFTSKTITFPPRQNSAGQTKEVSAIFYHRDLTMLELHDLYIDANYKADFAIEHIDLYGAPHLFNLYIVKARKVGILQYSAEFPIYDHVYVAYCHIGIFVSGNKFVDANPLEDDFYSGEICGSPNLLSFNKVRCLYNNYGIIINSHYDANFEDLETAHNSIAGVIIKNTAVSIGKYYTEGDSECRFYIGEGQDTNGITKWGRIMYYEDGEHIEDSDKTRKLGFSLPSLVAANLDGKKYKCIAAGGIYEYIRSPFYVLGQSSVQIVAAHMSISPRSYEEKNAPSYEFFTDRDAQGVDCMFLADNSRLDIGYLRKFIGPNGTSSALFASILFAGPSGIHINVKSSSHKLDTLMLSAPNHTGLVTLTREPFLSISYDKSPRADFNHDIEKARRDHSYQAKNEMSSTYVESYDNRPLYKYEGAHTKPLWIKKADIPSKFAGKKSIMASVTIKVEEETTTRMGLYASYLNEQYGNIYSYQSNVGAASIYPKGYYRFDLPIMFETSFDYAHISIMHALSSGVENVSVSHIYFYEMEDGIKAPHNFTAVTLQRGTTAQRPNPSFAGQQYFDTTLGKPIWWNGTAWVDNAGATV